MQPAMRAGPGGLDCQCCLVGILVTMGVIGVLVLVVVEEEVVEGEVAP